MEQQIQLMQERFPEIFGDEGEVTSLERSAAALAAAYLVRHYQQVEGGDTNADKIVSDVIDVCQVIRKWAAEARRPSKSDRPNWFIDSHPTIPD